MDALTQPSLDDALAALGAALAEPARARMLCALMDGRAHTATELALVAEIGPSTASGHLARLQDGAWIRCVPQGRHRYYTLADDEVAALIETMLGVVRGRSRMQTSTPDPLRHARTCYHHAAGEFAVDLLDRILARGWLEPIHDGYQLSTHGKVAFARIGLDESALREAARSRRWFARPCLDWSERRSHLGGALGAALLATMIEKRWVVRELDSRALQIPPRGQRAIEDWLSHDPTP